MNTVDDLLAGSATVRLEVRDRVAVVTLNRPEAHNAWTIAMMWDIDRAMRWCDEEDRVHVVVLTGAGDTFCVGAELDTGTILRPGGEEIEPPDDWLLPSSMRKLVVAAINGHAVGAGMTYLLHCDIRIVSSSAKVGFPFVRRGVVAELDAHWLLPRLIGLGRATDLLVTGRIVSGREAVDFGFCTEAVDAKDVLSRSIEIADDLASSCAPVSVALTKQLLWSEPEGRSSLADAENHAFLACASRHDAKEGVAAFLERRTPEWEGRATDVPRLAQGGLP